MHTYVLALQESVVVLSVLNDQMPLYIVPSGWREQSTLESHRHARIKLRSSENLFIQVTKNILYVKDGGI